MHNLLLYCKKVEMRFLMATYEEEISLHYTVKAMREITQCDTI